MRVVLCVISDSIRYGAMNSIHYLAYNIHRRRSIKNRRWYRTVPKRQRRTYKVLSGVTSLDLNHAVHGSMLKEEERNEKQVKREEKGNVKAPRAAT